MSTGTVNTSSTSSSSSTQSTINNSLAQLASNSTEFLTLLTTQLQNQDPLNPLDTNQFTSQLTQMAGVEQQLLGNQLLQTLVTQQGLAQGAGLIGDSISAPDPNGGSTAVSGVVSGVQEVNGQTVLNVGSSQVPLSSVTNITPPSSSSNSGQGS